MDKNIFLIFNDILYDLYQCTSAEDLKNQFLPRLKLLLPFSYASILLRDDTAEGSVPFQSHLLSRGLLRRGGGLPEGGRGRSAALADPLPGTPADQGERSDTGAEASLRSPVPALLQTFSHF